MTENEKTVLNSFGRKVYEFLKASDFDSLFTYIVDNWNSPITVDGKTTKISKIYSLMFIKQLSPYSKIGLTLQDLIRKFSAGNCIHFAERTIISNGMDSMTYIWCGGSLMLPIDLDNGIYLSDRNIGGINSYNIGQYQLSTILNSSVSNTIIKMMLLNKSIDMNQATEADIIKLCTERKGLFYLACGFKTERKISRESLDIIINDEENFFSENLAPSMSTYDRKTIAYNNVRQTILYQDNISKESYLKLINYMSDKPDLKASVFRIKGLEEKLKNASPEVQLFFEINKL